MNLMFNITLASINAILTNPTMWTDLMNALEITEVQNDIAITNHPCFGNIETSSDDSESENEEETEEIEKEKLIKLKHHFII